MNKDLKGPWIQALRSGDFDQGVEQLAQPIIDGDNNQIGTEFCCLGVLCEINGWDYVGDEGGTVSGPPELIGTYENPEEFGSPEILGLSGLSHDERVTLTVLNDDKGMTFPEIADWVEENL